MCIVHVARPTVAALNGSLITRSDAGSADETWRLIFYEKLLKIMNSSLTENRNNKIKKKKTSPTKWLFQSFTQNYKVKSIIFNCFDIECMFTELK